MYIFRSRLFIIFLSEYQWYRKWYGGRWERHWISVCSSAMWINMKPPIVWQEWISPGSFETLKVEDWGGLS